MGFWVASTRKGCGRRVGLAVDRHLAFLHRLQQRRLGARRRPVDLVGQQNLADYRAGAELKLLRLLVVEIDAGHV